MTIGLSVQLYSTSPAFVSSGFPGIRMASSGIDGKMEKPCVF